MLTSFHRKRLLLFSIAILLPSSLLVFLTWRLVGQQAELEEKRLADLRKRYALDVGQQLLAQLEQVKLQEFSAAAQGRGIERRQYSNGEVVLIGLTKNKQLLLPWDANKPRVPKHHCLTEATFARVIRETEKIEFDEKRYDHASALYLQCAEKAQELPQQVYARLLRVRALNNAGRVDESRAEYRTIVASFSDVVDEHGLPLWLYAPRCLLKHEEFQNEFLRLIQAELHKPSWLSPAEVYMLREFIAVLVESCRDPSVRQDAAECREILAKRIERLEQALALQTDFPGLPFATRSELSEESPEPRWAPYAEGKLLVSLAPPIAEAQEMAIVVQTENLLDSIVAKVPVERVKLGVSTQQTAEPLGASFPGLTVSFQLTDDVLGSGFLPHQSVYLAALTFVLCLTVLCAYLVWRDTNRDLKMAELRSQFVASVSHELRTPLTAIRMFAESLRLGRPEDPQAKQEYLDTIVDESHRLTRLLNNVLDFSKIEKGSRSYRKALAALSDVVESAARAMGYALEKQGLQLDIHVADGIPELYVDRDAIEQAVLNLLSNAIKYSEQARDIELRLYTRDGNAVIDVHDHGEGIEPAAQSHIFEKFYRVPSPENERIPGTGLGLALVSHIVAAHDGQVTVQSQPGEGSTFSIVLPLESQP
jgi:anti-sigma regulatory factor (Ser/Thr protein kinase)